MNATGDTQRAIVPSFVVQEEGSRKVLVYVNVPELKVKRSFPNLLKSMPANAHEKELEFQTQSFTLTIHVQAKLYSLSVARLPGEIQPERCSIKYQRGGCWITLIKADSTPWMNRICDELSPGLDLDDFDDDDDDDKQNPMASLAPPIPPRAPVRRGPVSTPV